MAEMQAERQENQAQNEQEEQMDDASMGPLPLALLQVRRLWHGTLTNRTALCSLLPAQHTARTLPALRAQPARLAPVPHIDVACVCSKLASLRQTSRS